jgi:hypothetical protein
LKADYTKAYSRRAQAYSELQQFDECVRDYEHLQKTDPEGGTNHTHPIIKSNHPITPSPSHRTHPSLTWHLVSHPPLTSLQPIASHQWQFASRRLRLTYVTNVDSLFCLIPTDYRSKLRQAKADLKKASRKDYYKYEAISTFIGFDHSSITHGFGLHCCCLAF